MPPAPLPDEIHLILARDRPRMIGHQQTRNGAALTTTTKDCSGVCASISQKRYLINARRCTLLTRELLRLLEIFEANGIAAIPFKGPALAL